MPPPADTVDVAAAATVILKVLFVTVLILNSLFRLPATTPPTAAEPLIVT